MLEKRNFPVYSLIPGKSARRLVRTRLHASPPTNYLAELDILFVASTTEWRFCAIVWGQIHVRSKADERVLYPLEESVGVGLSLASGIVEQLEDLFGIDQVSHFRVGPVCRSFA